MNKFLEYYNKQNILPIRQDISNIKEHLKKEKIYIDN